MTPLICKRLIGTPSRLIRGASSAPTAAAGVVRGAALELDALADRYRALLEAGEETGVVPQLEVWGFAKNLSRLAESTFVVIEAGHPGACLLLDVYHLYKG